MSRRLLVTDDALIIREMIKDAALAAGWEIAGEATNGEEAVRAYEQLRPDVVTMDVVMPGFDGLFGLEAIRRFDPTAAVVMVTALDQKDLLKEAFRRGATDFICKPFNSENLCQTLDRAAASRDAAVAV